MRRTSFFLALLLAAAQVAVPAGAAEDAASAPVADPFVHDSECVAVLKRDAVALAARVDAASSDTASSDTAREAARREMVRLTEAGFAFIGTAYKKGLRNPRADELLAEAERTLQGRPEAALRSLSRQCQAEGAELLQRANFLERALVGNRAKARVDKMLRHTRAPSDPPPSSVR